MPLTKLKGILGLAAEAQEIDIITAVESGLKNVAALKSIIESLGLKAEATPEEISGVITALKTGQTKTTDLEKEVAALKDREATRDATAIVEEAILAGKMAPAERELAIADAKRDLEGFKKRLALRPKVVPINDKLAILKDGGGKEGEPGPEAPVDQQVVFKAQKLVEEKKIDLRSAIDQVLKENPELARQYKAAYLVA